MSNSDFDVVVIGGGHAGCEAAAAAARRGATVALVTIQRNDIGTMSCNPSIGGVGKGHLVREVDALNGLLGRCADEAAIHYRMLNRSKGPAVQGPRVQCDRQLFRTAVAASINSAGITVIEAMVDRLRISYAKIEGVVLDNGAVVSARSVVIATGTFLAATMFRGDDRSTGGRIGERSATELAAQLRDAGFAVSRLKTGTPPRLDGKTIDWARLQPQFSDDDGWTMSPATEARVLPQLACFITGTTPRSHEIIASGLGDAPTRTGAIEGRGPRYCPSIEDKIVRFSDRSTHQIFLEPEGLGDATIYPNGISTSLSAQTQRSLVGSIPGLEAAQITQFGYAVEYDFLDPRGLDHRLCHRGVAGLFLAGQVNGTTGYEEAAAQGLVAGANAAAHAIDLEELILDRSESYIGVMVDDLVLQGVSEPYRMLTARAEYRLKLRADNAITRLGAKAIRLDMASKSHRLLIETHLARLAGDLPKDPAAEQELWADALYAPYLARLKKEIERLDRTGETKIASDFQYAEVGGLSTEMVERLERARPSTLGQAARIAGVTPAAVTAIMVSLVRRG